MWSIVYLSKALLEPPKDKRIAPHFLFVLTSVLEPADPNIVRVMSEQESGDPVTAQITKSEIETIRILDIDYRKEINAFGETFFSFFAKIIITGESKERIVYFTFDRWGYHISAVDLKGHKIFRFTDNRQNVNQIKNSTEYAVLSDEYPNDDILETFLSE